MKPTNYSISPAQPRHIQALPAIELSAATMLKGHAPPSVLEGSIPESEHRRAQEEGRLWVALADDVPVGFAIVEMLAEDLPHLQEIDVAPEHGHRGLGTALLEKVFEWLGTEGHRQITLTTFRDVPWNMPFYARLGFEEIPASELRPELAKVVADEAARGLDPARRVVMRYCRHPWGQDPRSTDDSSRPHG
jgi:GNAT superfamily N-acetyltransferase